MDKVVGRRVRYLLRMAGDRVRSHNLACPNCNGDEAQVVDRRYLVTELRRCKRCRLQYRAPTDPPTFNEPFYNKHYKQGFTTDLPDDAELAEMLASCFRGTPKDYSREVRILEALGVHTGAKLLDFGCSWGYGSWQFQQAGFDTWAAEVSRPRREFAAKKLGVRIIEDLDDAIDSNSLAGTFDCFFSAHVLEHVPAPSKVIELARRLVRPGGLFVSITPNGNQAYRAKAPKLWSKAWGEVHPHFIDDEFLDLQFADCPRIVRSIDETSAGFDSLTVPNHGTSKRELHRPELLFAVRFAPFDAARVPADDSRSWCRDQ